MPTARTATDVVDSDFLELRHRVLDIAAGLDRIDQAEGAQKVAGDRRLKMLRDAIAALTDGQGDRAQRVQMIFSLAYDEGWRDSHTK